MTAPPPVRTVWVAPRQVQCPDCSMTMFRGGIYRHRGSTKCRMNAKALPKQAESTALAKKLRSIGKVPMHGHFARAIKRRGLEELVGLEAADTKFLPPSSGMEAEVKPQWWAYSWVRYMYNGQRFDTKKTYMELHRLATLSKEDRDSHIQMLILACVDS